MRTIKIVLEIGMPLPLSMIKSFCMSVCYLSICKPTRPGLSCMSVCYLSICKPTRPELPSLGASSVSTNEPRVKRRGWPCGRTSIIPLFPIGMGVCMYVQRYACVELAYICATVCMCCLVCTHVCMHVRRCTRASGSHNCPGHICTHSQTRRRI